MGRKTIGWTVLLMLVIGWVSLADQAPLTGAIFTTTENGDRVNANIYPRKEDVYLDGGPGQNAPSNAAALPEGWYYFQVTDPSGKTLLSEDAVECRKFYVSVDGVITAVDNAALTLQKVRGQQTLVSCAHQTGIDEEDHPELGAITVQLMPYKNTPNNGGVYKVWVTRVECFEGDPTQIDNDGMFHGFIPRFSKTDNYKVKRRKNPPHIDVRKFNDLNFNGLLDEGEPEIGVEQDVNGGGWPVTLEDPLTVVTPGYTPVLNFIAEPSGIWTVCEGSIDMWTPTGVVVDGVPDPQPFTCVEVDVQGTDSEWHEVIFLNGNYGKITVCKQFDSDADGYPEEPPIPVEGFKVCIEGTDILGNPVAKICELTGPDGCVTFDTLIPGNYTVTEEFPSGGNWQASSDTSFPVELEPGECEEVDFLNFCTGEAIMHTKGFWQNQGCSIIDAYPSHLTFLNGMAPYAAGEVATNGQDNCGSVPCPATTVLDFDNAGELGCFIVAPNNQPTYPNIGLAQQLAAFTLNALTWLDGLDATLLVNGGMTAQEIIDGGVAAWVSGDAEAVQYWQGFLDGLNNAGTISFIAAGPCEIVYN